jgi:hypothetical protein
MAELTFHQTHLRVRRNLVLQCELALAGDPEVLNIPCVLGPVGSGKTSMAAEEASAFGLDLLSINNGENSDPTDVSGVPLPSQLKDLEYGGEVSAEHRNAKGQYMEWALNRFAAEACARPVMLFFDDIDKAPEPVQGALLGIMGNRRFRDKKIHPGTIILAAGNRTDDDRLANDLTESLRTRLTVFEMKPDVASFMDYAHRSKRIHEIVLGFLGYKPEFLHKRIDGANRFPTPRGWREATVHLNAHPDPFEDVYGTKDNNNWHEIIAEKCGAPVAKDFWAWYKVIRMIKVKELLETGIIATKIKDDQGKEIEGRMAQFAAMFAISSELNTNGVKKAYKGLNTIFDAKNPHGIEPEMRIALAMQLNRDARKDIGALFPAAANAMMQAITPLQNLQPAPKKA